MKRKSYRNSRKSEIAVGNALSQHQTHGILKGVAAENELLRRLLQTKLGLSAQDIKRELKQLQTNALLRELVHEKLHLKENEIDSALEQSKKTPGINIPVSVFKTSLSTLEVVVQFLKDTHRMQLSEIASLLNRDHRTIWHAYSRSQKKNAAHTLSQDVPSEIQIPILIFAERKNSPLEALVAHLHENHSLQFAEIGRMLLLSRKTVWTVYQRFKNNV